VEGVNELVVAVGEKVRSLMNADGAAEVVACADGEEVVTTCTSVGPGDGVNKLAGALVGESVDAASWSILTGKHIPFPEHSAEQPSPRLHFPKSSLRSGTEEWKGLIRVKESKKSGCESKERRGE
jgi:hypothetical protein